MKSNLIIACTVISLVWFVSATARSYRWVDENGVTIYSQSPPPSGKATIIKSPPPTNADPDETMKKLKARLDAMEEARKKESEANDKKSSAEKSAEIKKKNCETSKKNLATLEQSPRVKLKTDDGNYKMLPDEERKAEIEKAKQGIEKYCK
jgi:hypothetical protein